MMTRHIPISKFLVFILVLVIPVVGNLSIASEAGAAAKVEFPTKTISMVVPFAAGGGTDVVGRMIASAMEPVLSNKVIIVNKAGGAGITGIQEVATAKPDGYTILFTTGTPIIQTYMTKKRVDYNKFHLLAMVNKDSFTLVVPQKAKWATYEEFVQDAKANPGKIRISHPGVGTTQHLALPMIEQPSGIKFQYVPFAGNAPAHVALLGGHIEAALTMVGDVSALVKSGEVRMLAVSGESRLKDYPDVPTFKEKIGVDVGISHWRGIWALKEIPEPILLVLEDAILKAANSQGYKDVMTKAGYTPDNLVGRAKIQSRLEKEDKSIKDALRALKMIEE
jgi:tripartite-type tricarboxylate transporter receptor subunit TctC